jgi:hypothetical protein
MGLNHSPRIVTDGLVLCLDAANVKSYPGSGTTWTDMSGRNAHGTINGSVSFVSDGTRSYFNFATASNLNYISSTVSQNYLDFTIIFQPDFTLSGGLAGLIATSSAATSSDKSLRFRNVNGTGPWTMVGGNPGDVNDWANPTATSYYVNSTVSNTLVSGWNIFGGYRTNQGANFPANFSYFLGSSGYTGRGFRGKIAAVYMYNRQLSSDEQRQNFNAHRGRFGI